VFTLVMEAATTFGWHKYIKGYGDIIGIDKFGLSGPGDQIYKKYGFTIENIETKLKGAK
jgi:transketolase